MRKIYEGPEIEVRNYSLPPRDIVMTSDPSDNGDNSLEDGDDFDYNDNNGYFD
ncbi:MAG: hypothetical protein ACI4IQ_06260 [Eubacterium sp.]